jgi:hypothetical protein
MVGHQVFDQGSGLSHTGSQENAHSGFKFCHDFFGRYRQFLPLRMLILAHHFTSFLSKIRFQVSGVRVQGFRPRHSAWENSCDSLAVVELHENWTRV